MNLICGKLCTRLYFSFIHNSNKDWADKTGFPHRDGDVVLWFVNLRITKETVHLFSLDHAVVNEVLGVDYATISDNFFHKIY